MKQNIGKGWFEPKKDVVTNKGIKKLAPRHYDVSRKKGCGNVIFEPFAPPEKFNKTILQFEKNIETDKEFNKLMDDFFKENSLAEYDIEENKVFITKQYQDALIDFLKKKEINFK